MSGSVPPVTTAAATAGSLWRFAKIIALAVVCALLVDKVGVTRQAIVGAAKRMSLGEAFVDSIAETGWYAMCLDFESASDCTKSLRHMLRATNSSPGCISGVTECNVSDTACVMKALHASCSSSSSASKAHHNNKKKQHHRRFHLSRPASDDGKENTDKRIEIIKKSMESERSQSF